MLLDLKRRIAFLMIPKTASTSLRQTLMGFDKVNIFCNQDAHQGLGSYQVADLHHFTKVAIVRCPYDRHISWWRYELGTLGTKRSLRHALPTQASYCRNSLGEFAVDRIVNFGKLETEWREFALEFGYPMQLKRLNPSGPGVPYPHMNEELCGWIEATYEEDFATFGMKRRERS